MKAGRSGQRSERYPCHDFDINRWVVKKDQIGAAREVGRDNHGVRLTHGHLFLRGQKKGRRLQYQCYCNTVRQTGEAWLRIRGQARFNAFTGEGNESEKTGGRTITAVVERRKFWWRIG